MIKKLAELYFYGNLHIAIAAIFLSLSSYYILGLSPNVFYLAFAFSATLGMYSLHRIIGLKKILPEEYDLRFSAISFNEKFLFIFLISAAVLGCYSLSKLSLQTIILVAFSIPISIAYILPVFADKKRLRDFHYIKIFLIAIVWSWICWVIPAWEAGDGKLLWVLFFEQIIFFLAITIPFDIRDLKVDKIKGVNTIPSYLGLKKSLRLCYSLLLASAITVLVLYVLGLLGQYIVFAFILTNLITAISISMISESRTDLFYTGWIDGLIILKALLIILAVNFS